VPKEIAWLHLDLAAGSRHGGLGHIATEITGFGVRYTLELLRRGWPRNPCPPHAALRVYARPHANESSEAAPPDDWHVHCVTAPRSLRS